MSACANEAELVAAAQAGDRRALGQLLLSHYDQLARQLQPKLTPPLSRTVAVDDILQTAFAEAFRDIKKFQHRGEGAFYAWLKTIAEHRLQDAVKQAGRKKRGGEHRQVALSGGSDEQSFRDLLQVLAADDPTASQMIAREEGVQAIRVALAELPADYREAIRLRYFEGKSIEETATLMERTPASVRSLTDRAKKRLREAIGSLSLYMSKR